MGGDVGVHPGCDDLLQKFPSAFHKGDGSVCFRFGVVRLEWFVDRHYRDLFPGVYPSRQAVGVDVGKG